MSSFELSEREERYCLWLATPRADRKPATMQELADELGIHVSQLYRWRKRKNIRDRVMDIVDDAVGGFERVQQVLEQVYQDATVGATGADRARAQTIFLKYAGVLVDRQEKKVTTTESSEVQGQSDEEIEAELATLRGTNASSGS